MAQSINLHRGMCSLNYHFVGSLPSYERRAHPGHNIYITHNTVHLKQRYGLKHYYYLDNKVKYITTRWLDSLKTHRLVQMIPDRDGSR